MKPDPAGVQGAPREGVRLRAIALLPAAATVGNLLCGVVGLLCALQSLHGAAPPGALADWLPSWTAAGAYLIVLALVFDALDGRLARLTRRTSEFGAQLDSLADVVSFGVAPMILFLALLMSRGVAVVEWRLALTGALVFVSCAAIRLARYNAENTRSDLAQRRFSGLPAPGAAAVFASLLLLHEDFRRLESLAGPATVLRLALGPSALALSALMVSRLEHAHLFNTYVRRDQPLHHLVWLVAVLVLLWFWPALVLAAASLLYLGSCVAIALSRRAGPQPGASASSD